MSTQLVEIQPQELKFLFELKKQSSCPVRIVNKSHRYVAFKVKTTTPKKYCVRPNTGILGPKSTCDFIVTLQAQRVTPLDMICKDKFLLQCTVVPMGTADEDITSTTFSKEDGKYVEEKKLRVILVSPPQSPILSPMNGTLKKEPAYEASALKDQLLNRVEKFSPHHTVIEDVMEPRMDNVMELETTKVVEHKTMKDVEHKTMKDVESKIMKDVEEMKLVKDIEEMKSKLKEIELKLCEAEVTISKLTEEKRLSTQEKEFLQQELALVRSKRSMKRVQVGFPLLFVCMVALVSVMLGYLLHRP